MLNKKLTISKESEMPILMSEIEQFLIEKGISNISKTENATVSLGDCFAQQYSLEFEKDSKQYRIEINWRDSEELEAEPEIPEIWAMIFINGCDELPGYNYEKPQTLANIF